MEEEKKDVKKQDEKAIEKKETKPVEKKEEKQQEKSVEKKEEKKQEKSVEKNESKATTVKKENKKQEATKTDSKKKTNTTIAVVIGIIVVAVIAIVACVLGMADSPKKSVEDMLKGLKSGNYDENVLDALSEENFDNEAQKLLFDKLQWKIQKVQEEGDQATVEIEITNKDFKTIISNYMQKALKIAFSGNFNEEEMTNYLIEELNNKDIEMVTTNQTIKVVKQDGKWKVSDENDFVTILLPGFYDALTNLY